MNIILVTITSIISIVTVSSLINKITKRESINNEIEYHFYLFIYSVGITLTLTFVFVLIKISQRSEIDGIISSILQSTIYLPFVLYGGNLFSEYAINFISKRSSKKIIGKNEKLYLSTVLIICFAIILGIMEFERHYYLTMLTLVLGRIFWFDTEKEEILSFFSNIYNEIKSYKLVSAFVISVCFIATAIIVRFSKDSITIRSIGIGLYISLYISGIIGIIIGKKSSRLLNKENK